MAQSRQGPMSPRAKIILMLAEDPCVSRVARRLEVARKTVRLWRNRYKQKGLKGLADKPRPGRSLEIEPIPRCQVVAVACGKPVDFGVQFRKLWTIDVLHETVSKIQEANGCRPLSRSSLLRIRDVHIVWDNLNIHHDGPSQRWTMFNQRHGNRFHLHYTPVHASWINQIELFFGILQNVSSAMASLIAWRNSMRKSLAFSITGILLRSTRSSGNSKAIR